MKKIEITAIEKIEAIKNWCDWMDYSFVEKIKSVSDLEKLFDFASSNNIEFVDYNGLSNATDTDKEAHDYMKQIEKILRYKVY